MSLYLVDKPNFELVKSLASMDPEAIVVLLQDAVYLSEEELDLDHHIEIFAMGLDVHRRGVRRRLPDRVKLINYSLLVEMIVNNESVISLC